MNVLVIGYGSIGARHTNILNDLGCRVAVVSSRQIDYQVVYSSVAEAIEKEHPDYVVITNKTSQHYDTICELIKCGFTGIVMLEKPAFDRPFDIKRHSFQDVYVAYNLRFHPLVQKLKSILATQQIISVQAYVGQYLPEWRPQTDYRLCYSAHKEEGGGALRDLSHELDYLLWILGGWQKAVALGGQYSLLEIDSDDVFCIMMATSKCPVVSVQMNYLDRVARRNVVINTDSHTVELDLIAGYLKVDNEEVARCSVERNYTYRMQHEMILNHTYENLCSLEEGVSTLRLISAAEQSVNLKRWIWNE